MLHAATIAAIAAREPQISTEFFIIDENVVRTVAV